MTSARVCRLHELVDRVYQNPASSFSKIMPMSSIRITEDFARTTRGVLPDQMQWIYSKKAVLLAPCPTDCGGLSPNRVSEGWVWLLLVIKLLADSKKQSSYLGKIWFWVFNQ